MLPRGVPWAVYAFLLLALQLPVGQTKEVCYGGDSCCTPTNQCLEHMGDCDNDNDCEGSLICGTDNCYSDIRPAGSDFDDTDDCCMKDPSATTTSTTTPTSPVAKCLGKDNCCDDQLCGINEGDCDLDSQCSGSLVCGVDNCEGSTFDATDDCCKEDACQDGFPLGSCSEITLNRTKSGRTCQRWSASYPHRSDYTGWDHNYCRNPNGAKGGVWCYTTDIEKRWEYCDLPSCSGKTDCQKPDDCCSFTKPCDEFQGDCDSDLDCKAGLQCGFDNCLPTHSTYQWVLPERDCCFRPNVTGCIVEKDIHYLGYSIKNKKMDSQRACAELSVSFGGSFWTFNTKENHCSVKSSNYAKIHSEDHVSGNMYCGQTGGSTTGIRSKRQAEATSLPKCKMESFQCTLRTLGRHAALGHGWDVRSGNFINVSPWKLETIKKGTTEKKNGIMYSQIRQESNARSREKAVEVSAELGLSVWSGIVDAEASGKYLTMEKRSSNGVRAIIDYDYTSHFELFEWLTTPMDVDDFCQNEGEHGGATHLITSVTYGTKAFILFEKEASFSKDNSDIEASMKTSIKYFSAEAFIHDDVKKVREMTDFEENINVLLLGNALIELPTSMSDIPRCLRDLYNVTKHSPVAITIARIDQLCEALKRTDLKNIPDPIVVGITQVLISFADLKLRIKTLMSHPTMKVPILEDSAKLFSEQLKDFSDSVKQDVKNILVDVRSGNISHIELQKIIDRVTESNFGKEKADVFMDYLEHQVQIFDDYCNRPKLKLDPLGSEETRCTQDANKNIYIFTFNVLPERNLAAEYINGTLMKEPFIRTAIFSEVSQIFKKYSDMADSVPEADNCFLVQLSDFNQYQPVSFRVWSLQENKWTKSNTEILWAVGSMINYNSRQSDWKWTRHYGVHLSCNMDEIAIGACSGANGHDCNNGLSIHGIMCSKSPMTGIVFQVQPSYYNVEYGAGVGMDCLTTGYEKLQNAHTLCAGGTYGTCGKYAGQGDNKLPEIYEGIVWIPDPFFFFMPTPIPVYHLDPENYINTALGCNVVKLSNGQKIGPQKGYTDSTKCAWHYEQQGKNLVCPHYSFLVGRCTSGGWKGKGNDCPNGPGSKYNHGIYCCVMYIN